MAPYPAATSSSADMLGRLGSTLPGYVVGATTHSCPSILFVSVSCFSAFSAQHPVSYLSCKLAPPTHACIYLDSFASMLQVSCRLDGEGFGDEPLLPVAADGNEE